MYAGQDENSNFWLPILNGLKKHGVEDILVICGEGLIEFDQVIEHVFRRRRFGSVSFIRSGTQ